MEIAQAFVTIRPETSGFESELVAAVGGQEVDVPLTADTSDLEAGVDSVAGEEVEVAVGADTSDAEGEIDGIDAAPVEVPVTADTADAQASIDDLAGSIDAAAGAAGVGGGAVGGLTTQISSLTGTSAGATAGIGALIGGLAYAVSEGGEAQVTLAQLNQMVANMGANAGVTSQHLQSMATDLQQTAGFSDEAVMAGEAVVLTFQSVRNTADQPIFDRAIKSAADLARTPFGNGDFAGQARLLGRALEDPSASFGRLARSGVTFTQAQQDAITAMQESGNVAGAQAALLDGVDARYGGLAQTVGGTYVGATDRAKEAIGEMAEAMGAQMLPALEAVSLSVIDQVQRLNSWDDALNGALLSGPLQAIMGVGDGIEGVGTVIGELPPGLRDVAAAAAGAGTEMEELARSTDTYLQALFGVPDAQRDLRQSFADLATAMAEGTWDDQAVAMENVVTNTADVIGAMQAQGASQADLDATIYGSIATLAQMRNAGQITGAQFDTLSGQIAGVPHTATTAVTTPGLPESQNRVVTYRGHVYSVPPNWATTFQANTGSAIGSIQALIDKINQLNSTSTGSIASRIGQITAGLRNESAGIDALGADVGRATGGIASINQPQRIALEVDGRVLAEVTNSHNRVLSIAEGYEQ